MNKSEDDPSELLEFKQRKREVYLAVNLIETLDGYMDDQP
jgi:hypothetical protein